MGLLGEEPGYGELISHSLCALRLLLEFRPAAVEFGDLLFRLLVSEKGLVGGIGV